MIHRGTTREPKRLRQSRPSTLLDKLRRHRNKIRIYQRRMSKVKAASI